jgi:hypothetical protein
VNFYLFITQAGFSQVRVVDFIAHLLGPVPALTSFHSAILVLPPESDPIYLFSLVGTEYTGNEVGVVEMEESALRSKLAVPVEKVEAEPAAVQPLAVEPNWSAMTKAEIAAYCQDTFGETLDTNQLKDELIARAHELWLIANS